MMFIAIENQGSAYGFKKANTANKPAVKRGNAEQKRHEKEKQDQYKQRLLVAQQNGFDPKYDPADLEQMLFVARTFAETRRQTCRYGVSGSLTSMLKRVKFECDNSGIKFDTLVFVGHGGTGVMTIGLGASPMALHQAPKKGDKKTIRVIDDMGPENRMMNVKNKDTWLALFGEHKDCFSADSKGTFHVVFAGCSTGNQSNISLKFLTHKAAKALAGLLGYNVNAYGSDSVITNDDVEEILTDINAIKDSATGQVGTYALQSGVKLAWVKRP